MPLDLRMKKTRAIRRKLSSKGIKCLRLDASRITVRKAKVLKHFPQRKFAVIAN